MAFGFFPPDQSGSLYDLSSLSLPNDNYEIQTSGTSKFLINVCRSIVRQIGYDCPYHASACAASIGPGTPAQWSYLNIGQVNKGPAFDSDGKLVLEYSMGAICKDSASPDTHLSTKIVFK